MNRQCSLGWHDECSDPHGHECDCPCHHAAADVIACIPDVIAAWGRDTTQGHPVPTDTAAALDRLVNRYAANQQYLESQ